MPTTVARSVPASTVPRARNWMFHASRIVRVLLALSFLAAGAAKLMGVPALVEVFERIGWGQWFRFLTAAVEIAGAILLLAPGRACLGAGFLLCTMIGASAANLALGTNPTGAVVLGALALFVLWAERPLRR